MPNLEAHVILILPCWGSCICYEDYPEAELACLPEGAHWDACGIQSEHCSYVLQSLSPNQVPSMTSGWTSAKKSLCATPSVPVPGIRGEGEGLVL